VTTIDYDVIKIFVKKLRYAMNSRDVSSPVFREHISTPYKTSQQSAAMLRNSDSEKMWWINFREKPEEKRASGVMNHIMPKPIIFRLHFCRSVSLT